MLSHSVLLVVGGAILTVLLGALVFGSNGTAEDRRMQEERKLLRALEAQRRIRDARRMREARRRGSLRVEAPPPAQVEQPPVSNDTELVDAERERKREEKAAERRDAQERKAAAKAERATLRAAERQKKQEAKAALRVVQSVPPPALVPAPEPTRPSEEDDVEKVKPLAELPLFSWANRIDDDDQPARRNT